MSSKPRPQAAEPSAAEQPDTESRMRRALGLSPSGASGPAQRTKGPIVTHRGGRGGEAQGNRLAEAETALAAERRAREQAEASLRSVEASLREATTRLGHAELARDEAQAGLLAERRAREALEEQMRAASPPAPGADPAPVPRRRGRPPGSTNVKKPPPSDMPVEWWVPGWKARFGGS